MNQSRQEHSATLLANGLVLVVSADAPDSAELYDPIAGSWRLTGSWNQRRSQYTTTLLPDGQVLVAGGIGQEGVLDLAEVYDPLTEIWTPTNSMHMARAGQTATLLPSGQVLVAGGISLSGTEGLTALPGSGVGPQLTSQRLR